LQRLCLARFLAAQIPPWIPCHLLIPLVFSLLLSFLLHFLFSTPLYFPLVFSLPIQNTKKKKIRTQNDTLMVIEEKKKRKREWLWRPRPLVLMATEIRLLLWIFYSFYLCKCVWVLFRIYASIGSEPSNLKKPLILSSSNDMTLKLTSLTALL